MGTDMLESAQQAHLVLTSGPGSGHGLAVDLLGRFASLWTGNGGTQQWIEKKGRRHFILAQFAHRNLYPISQGKPIKNVCDGISDIQHEHPQPAMLLVRTTAPLVSGLADTGNGRQRAIDKSRHLTDTDVFRRTGQQITAMFASPALQVACSLELH